MEKSRQIHVEVKCCEECPYYRYVDRGSKGDDYEYCSHIKMNGDHIHGSTKIHPKCPLDETLTREDVVKIINDANPTLSCGEEITDKIWFKRSE